MSHCLAPLNMPQSEAAAQRVLVASRDTLCIMQDIAAIKMMHAHACREGSPARWHAAACMLQREAAAISYTVRMMLGIEP